MPRIVHLSDLHFGAHDPRLVQAVEQEVDQAEADLVVISGDFTQRARTEQFQEACQFLERLRDAGHEVLAVPGNHDVPLYDVLRRFLSPLTRYKRFVDDMLCPFHQLPGAAVLGINTARSLTIKDGRINREQIEFIQESFSKVPAGTAKVLVTHHPLFALPVDDSGVLGEAIGRQELALDAINRIGVDLLLAGHNHRASTHRASDLVTRAGGALVIQAGTATSVRLREEEQSFNILDVDAETVSASLKRWTGERFEAGEPTQFHKAGDGWRKSSQAEADAAAPA
ncbi:metallophosphoesterase [uncultured Sphingomonas sp.]|uniref:metallophosphoesterase family protein n=1 Tax=uncultured Sphingomonas sp. TaxID=158754 RepID=UPI0025D58880|nr:metallophosphoesterase [uncultured Sphingomonas sp.]